MYISKDASTSASRRASSASLRTAASSRANSSLARSSCALQPRTRWRVSVRFLTLTLSLSLSRARALTLLPGYCAPFFGASEGLLYGNTSLIPGTPKPLQNTWQPRPALQTRRALPPAPRLGFGIWGVGIGDCHECPGFRV